MSPLPDLRVAVFTDLHVGATTANRWHNRFLTDHPEETAAATVAAVNRERPDFVVITGDVSDTAGDDELEAARAVLDQLVAPWIVCPGNHDQPASGDRVTFDRVFTDRAPAGLIPPGQLPLPDGVAVVVLDANWFVKENEWRVFVAGDQMERAIAKLQRRRPDVLLVVCHYPFVRQSDFIRSRHPDGKNAGTLWEGEAVLNALAKEAGVALFFAGHQHFHHIVAEPRGNWLHCVTASLAEYPAEHRIVTLGVDGVTIHTACGALDVVATNPPDVLWPRGREEDRHMTWQPGSGH